jgi:type IV secretory pathway TraG/TraD family ATPase VirD4
LVNLSKGKIGEDNASMIGSLLVTKIQIDAMSRADMPMNERRDFYLYIDEFQNFATRSFATILSEARKYRLSLIVANQFTSQLDEEIKSAIFGNVGSVMAFTLGKDDAETISGQFK